MSGTALPRLRTGLRWFLGLLLLWAAVSKLANPTEFLGSVYAYQLPFPRGLLKLVAMVMPWCELLCALLLLANLWTESALCCALLMMAVFVAATGQAWVRGLHIECGCFDFGLLGLGRAEKLKELLESVALAFFRNLLLASIIWWLLRWPAAPQSKAPDHSFAN